jgi:hypothetical protein
VPFESEVQFRPKRKSQVPTYSGKGVAEACARLVLPASPSVLI